MDIAFMPGSIAPMSGCRPRAGLDWTDKFPAIAAALPTLSVRQTYLNGELCGVRPDGVTSFALIQNAADRRGGSDLVYFVFDLLYIDG
jgi:ATP-dependent DNA ligase